MLSAEESVRALACNGESNMEVTSLAQATARALAEAVAQTEITCEANGGEDTQACGFVEAEVTAIAKTQVCLPRASSVSCRPRGGYLQLLRLEQKSAYR